MKEELAKFGYRSKRRVEMFKNLAISWRLLDTICLNMAISETFSSQFWLNEGEKPKKDRNVHKEM
jgi:hypothetical protein